MPNAPRWADAKPGFASLAAVSEGVITEVSIPTTVDWVQRLPDLAVPMLRGAVGALLSALLCAMPDSAAVRERAS